MRHIQQAEANKPEPALAIPDFGFEAVTRTAEKMADLKKQSQFAPGIIGAKSFVKGDYDNNPDSGVEENKANQSQFKTEMRLTKPVRGEIATALRASQ